MTVERALVTMALLAALVTVGCGPRTVDFDDPAVRQMVSLLMPERIIVEPFTGLKSFDDDDQPDGLEVVLRPRDSFGDPVKIAGLLRVELYTFNPASGEHQGRQIQQWEIPLVTPQDQRTYWNPFTQMYEIPLELDLGSITPADKYVIEVVYNTPLGEHMISEYVYEQPVRAQTDLASQ